MPAEKLDAQDFFFEGESGKAALVRKAAPIGVDILSALKQDHDTLREFIEVLKDEHKDMTEKKKAFASFKSLLLSHAKSEEESVYRPGKEIEDLKDMVLEGFEEHAMAEEMVAKIATTSDPDQWKARAKVLAEMVEHHIDEEESELFPELEAEVSKDERSEMSQVFIALRKGSQTGRTAANSGVLSDV